jgi:hypothetical protein
MPRAFIEFPPLYPQIKPCILKNELPTIAPDRVSTVNDQYKTLVGGGRHKPEKAMGIARILAVHYGYLPDGFAKEVMNSETAKSIDKFVAREKAIFFEQKRNEVPQPCFTNLGLISNVRELEMIKPRPLFARKDSERDYFWQKRINGDLITTIFRLAKGMVDLRTLMSREDWARV